MSQHYLRSLCFSCLLLFLPKGSTLGQEVTHFWSEIGTKRPILLRGEQENIHTSAAFYFRVNLPKWKELFLRDQDSEISLLLPNPKGEALSFRLEDYAMMEENLAQKYPHIRTFQGRAVDHPEQRIYFTYTPQFFQARVEGPEGEWYVDSYSWPARDLYQSYFRSDCQEDQTATCRLAPERQRPSLELRNNPGQISEIKRHYRLAVSASYSYFNFYGRDLDQTMAGIVATVNRVNMVYERDLGVRLVLVADNDSLIITDEENPLFTRDFQEDIDNQMFIDDVIGSENYDIGHIFSGGGGGGYADLGSVCDNAIKAHGFTGLNRPQGDAFDIDFVAHEIGHQFGANHTFNGLDGSCGGGWYPFTAFEPGAGTTIMAYAGICGSDNITAGSDAYFHGGSIVEINSFLVSRGAVCAQLDTIANRAPKINLPPDQLYLPILTPFELTAEVTDEDNSPLLYTWEQVDRGIQIPLGTYGEGNEPLFRSFAPDTLPIRTFPALSDLLNNRIQSVELLPNQSRELNFQLTVRDPDSLGSAVAWSRLQYFVDGQAGPFRVDNPPHLRPGQLQAIEWTVNGTDAYPIAADSVLLSLSLDGGQQFNWLLATFPNTGRGVFRLPDLDSLARLTGRSDLGGDIARLKLKAQNNIFFDLSDNNISLVPVGNPSTFVEILEDPSDFVFCGMDTIRLPFYYNAFRNGSLSAAEVEVLTSDFSFRVDSIGPGSGLITLSGGADLPSGIYPVDLIVRTVSAADTFRYELNLQGQDTGLKVESLAPGATEIDVAIQPRFSWQPTPSADEYQVEVARDSNFQELIIQSPSLSDTFFQVTDFLMDTTLYFWRVQAFNLTCGTRGFSKVRSFTTQQIYCREYRPDALPLSFNALPFLQSSLTVPDEVSILDVNVKDIRGSYDNPNALEFRLRSPDGPIINLLNKRENCPHGSGFDFSVDDEAGSTFVPCPNEAGLTFEPVTPLSTFDGQRANGRWNLTIFDDGGEGHLENWVLEICFGAPAGTIVSSTQRPELVQNEVRVYPNPIQSMLHFESKREPIDQLRILDVLGRVVLRQKNIQARFHSVNLPLLPKGAYLYQLQLTDGRVQVGKLLR